MQISTLKKRRDFVYLSDKGYKVFTNNFIFIVLKLNSEEKNIIQIGYTVSKKVGNSPMRNFAKRRLKAAINLVMTKQNLAHCNIVLIARINILKSDFSEILKDLNFAIRKSNILFP